LISALDSSVILDVLAGDDIFSDASAQLIRRTRSEGRLIFCECVLAEIFPALASREQVLEFVLDWHVHFVPQSQESALLAGRHFSEYLQRGGSQQRVLPDFLIGAHARIHADRLVARDRGYLRDYFTDLTVLDPSAGR
jgi:predicted nucleic acid-binding protein